MKNMEPNKSKDKAKKANIATEDAKDYDTNPTIYFGAAHEEHSSKQDEREVWYSPLAEEAQSGVPTGKRSHKERITMVETALMSMK
ncbi:hypothetical protein GW17_00046690 [Ensete ventricosum]|nr:hypothetical protein GW17_00046690 [Ensete ventricosum]